MRRIRTVGMGSVVWRACDWSRSKRSTAATIRAKTCISVPEGVWMPVVVLRAGYPEPSKC